MAGSWWWSEIKDLASADAAAKSGYQAACVVSILTAVVATIAMVLHQSVLGVDGRAYADAALFAAVAWGVRRFSRGFAILGLVAFVAERAWAATTTTTGSNNIGSLIVAAVLFFGFVSGVRGTLAHHRFQPSTAARGLFTRRRFAIAGVLVLGLVAFALLGENVLACFSDDPTPSSCDALGIGGQSPKTRLRRAQDWVAARMDSDPNWQRWLGGLDADSVGGDTGALVSRGIRRLSFEELREWNRLRLALARLSPTLCEQMWT